MQNLTTVLISFSIFNIWSTIPQYLSIYTSLCQCQCQYQLNSGTDWFHVKCILRTFHFVVLYLKGKERQLFRSVNLRLFYVADDLFCFEMVPILCFPMNILLGNENIVCKKMRSNAVLHSNANLIEILFPYKILSNSNNPAPLCSVNRMNIYLLCLSKRRSVTAGLPAM